MGRDSGRLFGLSLIPQTDYNTALVAASSPKNYEQIAKADRNFANFQPVVVTNEGFSTGTAFATKSRISAFDVDFSLSERMTSQLIGRRLLALFGGYSVSSPAASVYVHEFTPLDPQSENDTPAYTYVEKEGEPALDADIVHDVMYPSCKAESGQLSSPASIDNGAYLMLNTAWRGSGKQIGSPQTIQTGSGVNFTKSPSHVVLDESKTENFFHTTTAAMTLYAQANQGGSSSALNCDFRGLDFNYNNNLKTNQGYQGCGKFQVQTDPDSGSVRGNLPLGNQSAELTFMLLMNKVTAQGFNPENKLRLQSVFSALLRWRGALITGSYYHQLDFLMNKLTASAVQIDSEDDLSRYQVSANTLAPGSAQPFKFILTNNVPSYLTLS